MKHDIVLYDYEGSPCARRVKIFLIEKGIPFRTQIVNLSKMEQKSPEYLEINPNGLVPALSHNGKVIFESSVINDYIEDLFPKVTIIPATVAGKIEAKKWENYELAMANVYRPLMYSRFMGPLHHLACTKQEFLEISAQATDNGAYLAWQEKVWDLKVLTLEEQAEHQKKLAQFVDLVERRLENRTYLIDERFGSADVSVYPRLTMIPLIGIKINKYTYPNVTAWIERISQRRSIRMTYTESEKSMKKLSDMGITKLINRILYKRSELSMMDRLCVKALKPILRNKLKISESLLIKNKRKMEFLESSPQDADLSAKSRALKIDDSTLKEPLMFYGYTGSPVSDRVVTLCRLLDVEYSHIEIDMKSMEHTKPPYKYLNPSSELPLLLHGDTVVHDSLFIAEYLCHYAKSTRSIKHEYFSKDSQEQASIRMWNAFDMGMRKEYRPIFFAHINGENLSSLERSRCLEILSEKMRYLNDQLSDRDFLVTDRVTYADLLLFTRLASFSELGIDECINSLDGISEWMKSISLHVKGQDKKKSVRKKRKSKAESA
ncbi:hypothetical protein A9Q99_16850 [Gammaproteobacteria bacterium 45_16_T64]|nr:hypothetical protein A9Q99_16850 [Gammaproteobacteria bacterium 45_16_T64]